MYWSNKSLGGSVLILTTDTAAVPTIATKQPITPSIPIAGGAGRQGGGGGGELNHTTHDKIYDRRHFEFLSSLRILFLSTISLFIS